MKNIRVIITQRKPLKVIGMLIRTNMLENKIPKLWDEFIGRMEELNEIAVPECTLGICLAVAVDDISDNTDFGYIAGRVVKNNSFIPDGMIYHELLEQEVAVFTHVGSLDNLSETYNYIYEEWLPESGYELADGDEVEWYDSRFKYDSADSQMDIHIPIKKAEKIENKLDIFEEIQTEIEEEK